MKSQKLSPFEAAIERPGDVLIHLMWIFDILAIQSTVPIPMEVETLSDDEEDVHDPVYDESEIFSHDDHYETTRRQEPLSKYRVSLGFT